jgi:hypothetical protein
LIIDVATELNENIKQTGQLVVGLIEATGSNQANLSSYYSALAKKTQEGTFSPPLPSLPK